MLFVMPVLQEATINKHTSRLSYHALQTDKKKHNDHSHKTTATLLRSHFFHINL